MNIFEIIDKLKRKIKFTHERKEHILVRHPEVTEFVLFEKILLDPDLIRTSLYDEKVLLYYTDVSKEYKYLVLVVKTLDGEGFILTAYKTNIIKEGKERWKKKS